MAEDPDHDIRDWTFVSDAGEIEIEQSCQTSVVASEMDEAAVGGRDSPGVFMGEEAVETTPSEAPPSLSQPESVDSGSIGASDVDLQPPTPITDSDSDFVRLDADDDGDSGAGGDVDSGAGGDGGAGGDVDGGAGGDVVLPTDPDLSSTTITNSPAASSVESSTASGYSMLEREEEVEDGEGQTAGDQPPPPPPPEEANANQPDVHLEERIRDGLRYCQYLLEFLTKSSKTLAITCLFLFLILLSMMVFLLLGYIIILSLFGEGGGGMLRPESTVKTDTLNDRLKQGKDIEHIQSLERRLTQLISKTEALVTDVSQNRGEMNFIQGHYKTLQQDMRDEMEQRYISLQQRYDVAVSERIRQEKERLAEEMSRQFNDVYSKRFVEVEGNLKQVQQSQTQQKVENSYLVDVVQDLKERPQQVMVNEGDKELLALVKNEINVKNALLTSQSDLIRDMEERLANKESEVVTKNDKLKSLKAELRALKANERNDSVELNNEIRELLHERNILQMMMNDKSTATAQCVDEVEQLRKAVTTCEDQQTERDLAVAVKVADAENLKQNVQRELTSCEAERIDLIQQQTALRNDVNQAETARSDLEKEILKLRYSKHPANDLEDPNKLRNEVNMLKIDSSHLESEPAKLRDSDHPGNVREDENFRVVADYKEVAQAIRKIFRELDIMENEARSMCRGEQCVDKVFKLLEAGEICERQLTERDSAVAIKIANVENLKQNVQRELTSCEAERIDLIQQQTVLRNDVNQAETARSDLEKEILKLRYSKHPANDLEDPNKLRNEVNMLKIDSSHLESELAKLRYSDHPGNVREDENFIEEKGDEENGTDISSLIGDVRGMEATVNKIGVQDAAVVKGEMLDALRKFRSRLERAKVNGTANSSETFLSCVQQHVIPEVSKHGSRMSENYKRMWKQLEKQLQQTKDVFHRVQKSMHKKWGKLGANESGEEPVNEYVQEAKENMWRAWDEVRTIAANFIDHHNETFTAVANEIVKLSHRMEDSWTSVQELLNPGEKKSAGSPRKGENGKKWREEEEVEVVKPVSIKIQAGNGIGKSEEDEEARVEEQSVHYFEDEEMIKPLYIKNRAGNGISKYEENVEEEQSVIGRTLRRQDGHVYDSGYDDDDNDDDDDGIVISEDVEEDWQAARAREREWQRGEPDDWLFHRGKRREQGGNSEYHKKSNGKQHRDIDGPGETKDAYDKHRSRHEKKYHEKYRMAGKHRKVGDKVRDDDDDDDDDDDKDDDHDEENDHHHMQMARENKVRRSACTGHQTGGFIPHDCHRKKSRGTHCKDDKHSHHHSNCRHKDKSFYHKAKKFAGYTLHNLKRNVNKASSQLHKIAKNSGKWLHTQGRRGFRKLKKFFH